MHRFTIHYNSCLRDYLFSLKRLSVGGWDNGEHPRPSRVVHSRLLILLKFCSMMIQRCCLLLLLSFFLFLCFKRKSCWRIVTGMFLYASESRIFVSFIVITLFNTNYLIILLFFSVFVMKKLLNSR